MDVLYGILGFLVVTALLTLGMLRQKKRAWAGVVTKIQPYTSLDSEGTPHEGVKIIYRTDAGKKGKIDLDPSSLQQCYPGLNVGDRLVKNSGDYMPSVVPTAEEVGDLRP